MTDRTRVRKPSQPPGSGPRPASRAPRPRHPGTGQTPARPAPPPRRSRGTARRTGSGSRPGCWRPRGTRRRRRRTSARRRRGRSRRRRRPAGRAPACGCAARRCHPRPSWRRPSWPGRTTRYGRPLRARPAAGRCQPSEVLLDLGPLLLDVFQTAAHEEGLLGHVVVLTVGDLVERVDGLPDGDGRALDAGELLGNVGVLRQEPLDPAGPGHDDLVLFGQLVDTEDRDDVLQLLVALQDLLDPDRAVVVSLPD